MKAASPDCAEQQPPCFSGIRENMPIDVFLCRVDWLSAGTRRVDGILRPPMVQTDREAGSV